MLPGQQRYMYNRKRKHGSTAQRWAAWWMWFVPFSWCTIFCFWINRINASKKQRRKRIPGRIPKRLDSEVKETLTFINVSTILRHVRLFFFKQWTGFTHTVERSTYSRELLEYINFWNDSISYIRPINQPYSKCYYSGYQTNDVQVQSSSGALLVYCAFETLLPRYFITWHSLPALRNCCAVHELVMNR